ncbi:hypothetical protein ACOME3_000274 [Neoechinorhynchus agilis]
MSGIKQMNNNKERLTNEIVHRLAFVVLSICNGLGVNAIFVELPFIISFIADKWDLPALINMILQLSNVMAFLALFKVNAVVEKKDDLRTANEGQRNRRRVVNFPDDIAVKEPARKIFLTEISPLVYVMLVAQIASCSSMGFILLQAFDGSSKTLLFAVVFCVFLVGFADTTLVYSCEQYIKYFENQVISGVFWGSRGRADCQTLKVSHIMGVSLGALIPSALAGIQGSHGLINCTMNTTVHNNQTLIPQYARTHMTFRTFMLVIGASLLLSLISFIAIEAYTLTCLAGFTNLLKSGMVARQSIVSTDEFDPDDVDEFDLRYYRDSIFVLKPAPPIVKQPPLSEKFQLLFLLNKLMPVLKFGVLPALMTYSILPYGDHLFYVAAMLIPLTTPLATLVSTLYSHMSGQTHKILTALASFFVAFIWITASYSPCPYGFDLPISSLIIIVPWLLATFLLSFCEFSTDQILAKIDLPSTFACRFGVKIGQFAAACLMYVICSYLKLFKKYEPCDNLNVICNGTAV